MIHIRLLHHRPHRLLDRAVSELEERMLLPDLLEVEVRAPGVLLEERERPRVRHSRSGDLEVRMAGDDKSRGCCAGI